MQQTAGRSGEGRRVRGAHRARRDRSSRKTGCRSATASSSMRMMSQHAHSEIVGMLPEGNWITRAPSLRRKMSLLAKVQDEAGHGLYIYCGTETLGVDRARAHRAAARRHGEVLEHLQLSDADLGGHRRASAGSSTARRSSTRRCSRKASYGPYARAMVRICKEENFHKRQGYEIMATLAAGTPAQRAMAQDAVNRWWWPSLMMFGPHDSESSNTRRADALGREEEEQRRAAPALRESHRRAGEGDRPRAARSRPRVRRGDARTGSSAPIDWDEFWRVVKGDGPCNRERLAARRKAHDDGAWVRVAAAAYAAKRRARRSRVTQPSTAARPPSSRSTGRRSSARPTARSRHRSGRCGRCSCSRPRATPHEHAGSVHAVDAEQALQNARDVYARRGEAVSIWVVPSAAITASTPDDMGPFFDPGQRQAVPASAVLQGAARRARFLIERS